MRVLREAQAVQPGLHVAHLPRPHTRRGAGRGDPRLDYYTPVIRLVKNARDMAMRPIEIRPLNYIEYDPDIVDEVIKGCPQIINTIDIGRNCLKNTRPSNQSERLGEFDL